MSDIDLVMGDESPAAKKPAAKRGRPAEKKVEPVQAAEAPKKDHQSGWPIIWIDAVDGMPNYEEVGVNGNVRRIMREVEVAVPPEVVEVLRNAIGTRLVEMADPQGGIQRKVQKFSAIPWRLVGYKP